MQSILLTAIGFTQIDDGRRHREDTNWYEKNPIGSWRLRISSEMEWDAFFNGTHVGCDSQYSQWSPRFPNIKSYYCKWDNFCSNLKRLLFFDWENVSLKDLGICHLWSSKSLIWLDLLVKKGLRWEASFRYVEMNLKFLLQSLVPSGRGRGPMAVGRLRNILFIWPDAAVGKNGDFSTNLGRKHPALNSTKHRRWTAIQERERKRDFAWDVLSSVANRCPWEVCFHVFHLRFEYVWIQFILCLYHLLSYLMRSLVR